MTCCCPTWQHLPPGFGSSLNRDSLLGRSASFFFTPVLTGLPCLQAGLGAAVAAVYLQSSHLGENLETSTLQNPVNDPQQPPEEFTAQYLSEVHQHACLADIRACWNGGTHLSIKIFCTLLQNVCHAVRCLFPHLVKSGF